MLWALNRTRLLGTCDSGAGGIKTRVSQSCNPHDYNTSYVYTLLPILYIAPSALKAFSHDANSIRTKLLVWANKDYLQLRRAQGYMSLTCFLKIKLMEDIQARLISQRSHSAHTDIETRGHVSMAASVTSLLWLPMCICWLISMHGGLQTAVGGPQSIRKLEN